MKEVHAKVTCTEGEQLQKKGGVSLDCILTNGAIGNALLPSRNDMNIAPF